MRQPRRGSLLQGATTAHPESACRCHGRTRQERPTNAPDEWLLSSKDYITCPISLPSSQSGTHNAGESSHRIADDLAGILLAT